jgi:hypothetical protein
MKFAPYSLITFTMLSFLFSSAATAELRTWTDSQGHTIEAELVENMHGHITLQRENGKEAHISISDLSAADQKYVLKNSPPKIDISVSEITSRKNKGFSFENQSNSAYDRDIQIQTTSSHYKVTLKKSGTIPYDKPIQAELYVFGYKKLAEEFVLLDKTIKKFTFTGDAEKKFIFESDQITTRDLQDEKEAGIEYHGNLVVLVDHQGRVFNQQGSRSRMQEHTAFIRKLKEGATATKEDVRSAENNSQ